MVSAIDELGHRGEVKVTEWIRGGQLECTKSVEIKPNSVYGKGCKFTKQWWRNFICQVAAAGYIKRMIQTASFGTSKGVYASLMVTEMARDAIAGENSVLLPEFLPNKDQSLCSHTSSEQIFSNARKRNGKGCHLLSLVKNLIEDEENWKKITDKENYQYLGTFSEPSSNFIYFLQYITQLPHYTADNAEFLWSDVQFSKGSSTKQIVEFNIGGKGKEKCVFHKAQCTGVK